MLFAIFILNACMFTGSISKEFTSAPPGGVNSTCNGISFTPQIKIGNATQTDSDQVTMICSEPTSISVSGDGSPVLVKNGNILTAADKVNNGDILSVRLTSAASDSTSYKATVSIGSSSSVFSVTTGDFIPTAFTISPVIGASLSSVTTSSQTTLSGFDGTLTATVTGAGSPTILVNGVVVGTSASIQNGNAISLRLTSASTENATRQATVSIGGVSAVFDVTTTGDATAPTITSVSPPANGSYKQGANIDFTVNFTESVTVTATPRILLNIGGTTKYANYFSGTGTVSLIFRYTMEAAMNDSDGIGTDSLQLNGGSINDGTGNAADLSFFSPSTNLVLVDTIAPSVQSAAGPAAATYVPGQYLSFALTFNEAVSVSGTPRLTLTIGSATRYANYLSGTGTTTLNFRYSVQSGDADPDGIVVASPIDLNTGGLQDAATNQASLTYTAPNTSLVIVTECPANYVPVPPLAGYTTSFFCVAKFEMKAVTTNPTLGAAVLSNVNGNQTYSAAWFPDSRPDGTPFVNINQRQAATMCDQLNGTTGGTGSYQLITNAQWQALAGDIAAQAANWSGVTPAVGVGKIARGHSDNALTDANTNSTTAGLSFTGHLALAAKSTDGSTVPWSFADNASEFAAGYRGTGNTSVQAAGSGWEQRRTHYVSSGDVVWDLAGNVWEWVRFTEPTGILDAGLAGNDATHFNSRLVPSQSGNFGASNWYEIGNPNLFSDLTGTGAILKNWFQPTGAFWNNTGGTYPSDFSLGRTYSVSSGASSTYAVLRGAGWFSTTNAGVFASLLYYGPTFTSNDLGFRCAFSPP